MNWSDVVLAGLTGFVMFVIVYLVVSAGHDKLTIARLRSRIDTLEATLGVGPERARRESAANLRAHAIWVSKEGVGGDRAARVEALLRQADEIDGAA